MLGVRVRFRVDAAELREAVRRAYRAWAELPVPDGPGVELRLSLRGRAEPGAPRVEVREPSLLRLRGSGVRGVVDSERGAASCALSEGWLADPPRLAEEVLDTLLLFLLTPRDRVPLHAAAIVHHHTALLLAGPSGSGKSTLALAAARAGLPVLSDDAVYLQRHPRPRVWGMRRPIHVISSNARAAPAGTPLRYRVGRWKERIDLPAGPLWADRAALVLLEPGQRVAVERLSGDALAAALAARQEPGFDRFGGVLPDAVRAVARDGVWRVTLSRDPEEGLRALLALSAEPVPA